MMSPGATLWFTGLPASGKSTIARIVYEALRTRGIPSELLDGSEVRESLSRGLGFGREDREEHVRRMGYVAKLLSRNGVIVIVSAVSPYRATRDEVRQNVSNFVEVYVDCPADECERRDSEGQYQRARRGEIPEFTGVNAPYEAPERPEVHIFSAQESPETAAWKVLRTLELLRLIASSEDASRDAQELEIRQRLAALGYT
jgi:adenylylsulfate kinase